MFVNTLVRNSWSPLLSSLSLRLRHSLANLYRSAEVKSLVWSFHIGDLFTNILPDIATSICKILVVGHFPYNRILFIGLFLNGWFSKLLFFSISIFMSGELKQCSSENVKYCANLHNPIAFKRGASTHYFCLMMFSKIRLVTERTSSKTTVIAAATLATKYHNKRKLHCQDQYLYLGARDLSPNCTSLAMKSANCDNVCNELPHQNMRVFYSSLITAL